jgi:hypothetical protein
MNRLIVLISSLVPEPIAAAVIGKAVRALASDEEGSDAVNA